jgi:hypothetical protein
MHTSAYLRPTRIALITGMVAFGLLLFLVSLSPAQVQAAAGGLSASAITSPITATNFTVYLPLTAHNYVSEQVKAHLASPQDGAVLDTLLPVFTWDTGTQPADTLGCLALATTPNPTGCHMSYLMDYYGSHMERVMWYNLQPDTIYYWRVGVIYNYDYDHPIWSDEWSFTTGSAGGPLLPAPLLQSPSNNSTISNPNLTLTWQPVAGALEYSVTIHGLDANRWYGSSGISDTQKMINLDDLIQMGYGNKFEWYVQTRNDYAWSDSSQPWKFTYPAK